MSSNTGEYATCPIFRPFVNQMARLTQQLKIQLCLACPFDSCYYDRQDDKPEYQNVDGKMVYVL